MSRRANLSGCCLILDDGALIIPAQDAMVQALRSGVRFFQYRNKNGTKRAVYETVLPLVSAARHAGALLIVNDYADIAAATGADGVHLGQDDLPIAEARKLLGREKIIGISTHGNGQAAEAERSGANYIGFGPVFPTATKNAGAAKGIDGIAAVKRVVTIPVIAIGGITPENAGAVLAAGADGVAVIGAVLAAGNIAAAAELMIKAVSETENRRAGLQTKPNEGGRLE